MLFGPFFWGTMAAILMDVCTSDKTRPWWVNAAIRVFLYIACAMAVDRFFLVIPL